MVSPRILEVLKFLCEELRDTNVKWVLAGSLSLALQGVAVEPKDIDVLTDRRGAFETNRVLKKYEVKKVEYSQTDKISSYLGVFEIDDIKVEVMGDYKEREDEKWISLSRRLRTPKIVEIDGFKIPVSPLEDQLMSYKRSKRPKDAEKVERIRKHL